MSEEVKILNGDDSPALFGDGECELRFQKDVGLGEDIVGLAMVNGGGFTWMLIPRVCWPELRAKIDKLMGGLG